MKVLHISKYYPPVLGGIESVTWELVQGLNRQGTATDVLCANQRPRTVHEQSGDHGVTRAASMGTWLSTSMAPALLLELRRLLARRDLIHVHMPDPMAALAVWACRPQVPVVVHWHSDVIRQRMALRLYEPLQTWLLARADAVIATSPPYAESSPPLRPWRAKVHVVPIGISDIAAQASEARARQIRDRFSGRRIVFALGRMTHYKGFDVLIQAAAGLPQDTVVLIGGEGEMLAHFRNMVRGLGLEHRVQLLGPIRDDDLANHFDACDIFCMSSTVRAEAYGVAMLEAMLMGKPVVATDIAGSGVPWVNQHGLTGLNVPAGDAQAMCKALTQLLDDAPLRQRMGQQARQRYLECFSAQLMVERTQALYAQLLRR